MKRPILCILTLYFLCNLQEAKTNPGEWIPGRQVITAEEIQEAGLMRLGDIFLLIDGWEIYTIDGFTWGASANSLSPAMNGNWIIMINSQRMDNASFDEICLNALPISISDIDSIEINNTPQIYEGEFVDQGLMNIHTRSNIEDYSVSVRYAIGQETGDPGPYRYTSYATPNVDRIGEDISYSAGLGSNHFQLYGSAVRQDHYPTDASMYQRGWTINNQLNPKMEMRSYCVQSSLDKEWLNVDTFVGVTDFSSFLFFQPLGREIPTSDKFLHMGANGSIPVNQVLEIRFRSKYSQKKLWERDNSYNLDFDWATEDISGRIEGVYQKAGISGHVGLGMDCKTSGVNDLSEIDPLVVSCTYAELGGWAASNIHQKLSIYLSNYKGDLAFKGASSNIVNIGKKNSIFISFSYTERHPFEDNAYGYWRYQGYTFPKDEELKYQVVGNFNKSGQFCSDLIWRCELTKEAILETSLYFRSFDNLYSEQFSAVYDSIDSTFPSDIMGLTDISGQVLGGYLSLTNRLSSAFSQSIFMQHSSPIAGDDIFRDTWRSRSAYRISYLATYYLDASSSIWGRINYQPGYDWSGYKDIQEQTNGDYSGSVGDMMSVDLSFQKHFWKRRLWFNLGIHNALNDEIRYHPIGASFDLTYYIQLRATLGSSQN